MHPKEAINLFMKVVEENEELCDLGVLISVVNAAGEISTVLGGAVADKHDVIDRMLCRAIYNREKNIMEPMYEAVHEEVRIDEDGVHAVGENNGSLN